MDLIEKINQSNDDDDQISCIIADTTVGWALEVVEKMGIKRAAVWPAGPGNLAFLLHVPKLIEDGIIDTKGKNLAAINNSNLFMLLKKILIYMLKPYWATHNQASSVFNIWYFNNS